MRWTMYRGGKLNNSKLIYALLKRRPMTRLELEEKTGMKQNTVEKALKRLRDSGVKILTVQTTRTNIRYELGN